MFGKRDKKEEEEGAGNPFHNLEKSSVIQEARTFNETPINPRKCRTILTRILYLLNQGETLNSSDATATFFATTKLFQSRDPQLRRLVYLLICELAGLASDVIIVTSSLTKDMTGKEDLFRAPALRALARITDASMLPGIERYLKQAIVDKNRALASAALVSSLHLARLQPDIVKRWINEVQEAANSDSIMLQYHALGILYFIRKSDKLAVSKLITKFSKQTPLRSPLAYCLLIRIVSKMLEDETSSGASLSGNPLFEFLSSCLSHKAEMVSYESARAIVQLSLVQQRQAEKAAGASASAAAGGSGSAAPTSRELASAVNVLGSMLVSPRPTQRFAAVRTLNQLAASNPGAVSVVNQDLEAAVTDANRCIATLAITTLLKTGSEAGVDRLMKQISSFMSEIADEFKVIVVDAIRTLCLKFPRKHGVLLTFLSRMLRDEGGFEYKRAIVESIFAIIEDNPESKESALLSLCEFIEDCEYVVLSTRVLHLLGREGPRTLQPSKYIRFIYNRVALEQPPVRAAAISALAKFGASCPDLLNSVLILLQRSMIDADDEVRDLATFYYYVLKNKDRSLVSLYILEGFPYSLSALERALGDYLRMPPSERGFDVRAISVEEAPVRLLPAAPGASAGVVAGGDADKARAAAGSQEDSSMEKLAKALPILASLGPRFRTCPPALLTESDTEFAVACVKHVFADYIVLQFDISNTLVDQQLELVTVQLVGNPSDGFQLLRYIECAKLPPNTAGTAYAVLRFPEDPTQVTGVFSSKLKFVVKDCDPTTGKPDDEAGYEDEYTLEDVEVTVADQVNRVPKSNFEAVWTDMGSSGAAELEETYSLTQVKSLEEAVKTVSELLGLAVCERSDKVPEGKQTHALLLSGVFRGGHEVLVRARMAVAKGAGVSMKIEVRATDENTAALIVAAVS